MTNHRLTPIARKLRREMTDTERLLWSRLRNSQLEGRMFVKQFPIGTAVADFACRSARLVVELDGGQHADATEEDAARTCQIELHGYTVIRFWDSDVTGNLDGVLEEIRRMLLLAADREN